MKIIEAIHSADALMPNGIDENIKIKWLSAVDGLIHREILSQHEADAVPFSGYTENTDTETELLVPFPYDLLYRHFLSAQIAYANAEYIKYNNHIDNYNTAYTAFANHYNRENKAKGGYRFRF